MSPIPVKHNPSLEHNPVELGPVKHNRVKLSATESFPISSAVRDAAAKCCAFPLVGRGNH